MKLWKVEVEWRLISVGSVGIYIVLAENEQDAMTAVMQSEPTQHLRKIEAEEYTDKVIRLGGYAKLCKGIESTKASLLYRQTPSQT